MAEVAVEGVTKRFDDGTVAVDHVSLTIDDGEFVVLVGPSGCGKSTLLRMVAGLESVSSGHVRIGQRVADDLSPAERDVAMVFQDYALYPHMTAYRNIAFALKPRRLGRKEVDRRVRHAAGLLGIDHLLDRRPRALSGGERQRVAMGRAIVRQPAAFLMDEPLSNLDAKLRVQMRTEMRRLHDELATTFLYVTHDQVEAMTMGQRVAVLRRGQLQQVDTPQRLYAEPANVFVAGFIGSPPMNLAIGTVEAGAAGPVVALGHWRIPAPARCLQAGAEVIVGIRPEHLDAAAAPTRSVHPVTAEVDLVEPLGSVALLHFRLDAAGVEVPDVSDDTAGPLLRVIPAPTAMIAAVDARDTPQAQTSVRLLLDLDCVRVFDRVTGAAL